MKEIQTDELRELQMQILDHVDAFCRKYNIKYTISGGTLLGAVRHGGFIPWDDDMDIQMLRNEYIRFTTLWNQEKDQHDNYELINIESGNNMGYPFGKVHDIRTTTYIGKLERTGVFIDVFPIDNVKDEDDFLKRHAEIKRLYNDRFLILQKMKCDTDGFNLKRWLRLIVQHAPQKSYNQIAEEINQLALSYTKDDSPLVYEMIAGMRCKRPIPRKVFEEYTYIRFENRQYMAVLDYDTYLSCTFGDYMTPPPVKEQVTHHLTAYWK